MNLPVIIPTRTSENINAAADVNGLMSNCQAIEDYINYDLLDANWPVGITYNQYTSSTGVFSDDDEPGELLGGTWTQLFEDEGIFFRTEGGYSATARSAVTGIQGDVFKLHHHRILASAYTGWMNMIGTHSAFGFRDLAYSWQTRTNSIEGTGNTEETRPVNRLKKVWKRTA